MVVDWMYCGDRGSKPCLLASLNLNTVPEADGVYVIWHETTDGKPKVVRLGQGYLPDRIAGHKVTGAQ